MEKLHANIQLELTESMLENLLVTAFEGGCNYWAELGQVSRAGFDPNLDWYQNIVKSLMNKPGYKIEIYDVENEGELLGELSYESLRKNLPSLGNYFNEMIALRDEEFDAETCDILFQCLVMGEVIFG